LYREFQKAKAICVIGHIEKLLAAKDWRAHAFWLERMTEEFAGKNAKQMKDEEEELKGVANNPFMLTPETIKRLSDAYDRCRAERKPLKQSRKPMEMD
jgi:hypothetical protein